MQKPTDVLRRSDRVLAAALIVVFASVSAAVCWAAAYRPQADHFTTAVAVAPHAVAAHKPATRVAPAKPTRTAAEELAINKIRAEHRCLSEALYYEARGEPVDGQKAIAEVVFTRMQLGNYGHSICAVVYEGASQSRCQFSFTCDGELALKKQPRAWLRARVLAARILAGEERLSGATGGATNFHAITVEPDWALDLQPTAQIGNHIFYRDAARSRPM